MRARALSGRIRLTATSGSLRGRRVTLVVSEAPQIQGGAGGFQSTDRPGRRPAKWWQGGTELTQSITGFLDASVTGDVDAGLRILQAFGRKPGGDDQPPSLRLDGDVTDVYSMGGGLWVMQGLALADRMFRRDGSLRRQQVTVDLADFDDAPSIAPVTVKRTRTSASKSRTRTVTTRRGDTLRAIALREVGTSGAWTSVRDWNARLFKGSRPVGPDDPLRAGLKVAIK